MLSRSGSQTFQSFLNEELKSLDDSGLRRRMRVVDGSQKIRLNIDGREVLNFSSNNYLGLADDPRLKEAAARAIEEEGWGAGASRLISGNFKAHQALEKKIARFKNTENALVFTTGYMANVGVISSLFGREDIIFCDKLNHASIIDGILLSQAKFRRYPHNDMDALEAMLRSVHGLKKRAIITDSVFSMDGDVAPLEKIVELAEKYDCVVMIDEAHALGVFGKKGNGLAEHCGLEDRIDIQMGTLSKAAGSLGGYICGSSTLIDYLVNQAGSFIYTTGMPPSVAAASLKAIEIIESEPGLRERLWQNTEYMQQQLRGMGFNIMKTETPIVPILVGDPRLAVELAGQLLQEGIFVSAIRPPTVPVNTARLRLAVTAAHTTADLDAALSQLRKIGKKLCLI